MNNKVSPEVWTDSDDAPPLDAAWFDGASVYDGTKLVRPRWPQFIEVEGGERLVVIPGSRYRRMIDVIERGGAIALADAADADGSPTVAE